MENIFKNDIKEGNKVILSLTETFKSPIKQTAISQIIFQHTYPTFFKRESHSLIALISFYISGKITENVVKLNPLLETYFKLYNIRFQTDKAIFIESRMVEMCSFNFDIVPVHLYVQSICKDLDIDSNNKLSLVSEIHNDNRVNYINYINGIYDPEIVAVSVLNDDEIDIFEVMYYKEVDRTIVNEGMKIQFLTMISTMLCTTPESRCDYSIKKLYDVTVSQPGDAADAPLITPINNTRIPGISHEYIQEEDMLIISYSTPASGNRRETTLSIVPKDGVLPTLFSVIVPSEIEQSVEVNETPNATTGANDFDLQIVIPENATSGVIKIRFLSTVDIKKVNNDPNNNDYNLASEYFTNSNRRVNVQGYPLKNVTSLCNSVCWIEKVEEFLSRNFVVPSLSNDQIYVLSKYYKSEVTRKALSRLYRDTELCEESVKPKSRLYRDDDEECYDRRPFRSSRINVDVKSKVNVNISVDPLSPKSINKAVGICALFNMVTKFPNCYNEFMETCGPVISFKQELSIDLINTIVGKAIESFDVVDPCIDTYLDHRVELGITDCSYDDCVQYYGNCIDNFDQEIIQMYCQSNVSAGLRDSKPRKAKARKAETKKKCDESSSSEDSSSDSETPKEKGSGYRNIIIGVAICTVIGICIIGGSYLI